MTAISISRPTARWSSDDKGIDVDQFLGQVFGNELAGVVPGKTVGHLGQVIGAEAHELHLRGQAVCAQGGARCFHHGADLVGNGDGLGLA